MTNDANKITERRKAVWYHNEDEGILTCSWCISEFDDDIMKYWNNIPNFCPNCGSEMQWCDCADEVEAHDNRANSQLMKLSRRYPSAQQWIPCSERLPEESGRYLLTDKDGEVRFGMFSVNYGMWWGGANRPTAWAFLPKPYDVETKRDEPKPCPFCGHKATVKRDFIGGFSKYYVRCENDNCKLVVATLNYDTINDAIESWNKRFTR